MICYRIAVLCRHEENAISLIEQISFVKHGNGFSLLQQKPTACEKDIFSERNQLFAAQKRMNVRMCEILHIEKDIQ